MSAAFNLLVRFNDVALRVGRSIAWVLIGVMTAIVLYQVFFRYALNNAPSWSEAASRALMVWMTFLVAPTAYRWGGYVSIDFITHKLPRLVRTLLSVTINVVALILIVELLLLSFNFVDRGLNKTAAGLPTSVLGIPIKVAYIRLAMPVGFVLMITVSVELIIKDILRLLRLSGDEEEQEQKPDYMLLD